MQAWGPPGKKGYKGEMGVEGKRGHKGDIDPPGQSRIKR